MVDKQQTDKPPSASLELDGIPLALEEIVMALPYTPSDADLSLINRAYRFAESAHAGQKRLSGEDYIIHPICTTVLLALQGVDATTLAAGLLHDVLEDTAITAEQLRKEFGEVITRLVQGVSKVSNYDLENVEDAELDNMRKMLFAMAKDVRVVLIKLCDRLHNLRTIEYLPPERRLVHAEETLNIFAPIAHRLGMAQLRWEMEDYAFRELYPKDYFEIANSVATRRATREKNIKFLIKEMNQLLTEGGIKADIAGRPKHLYSIWMKMKRENLPFDEIYDLLAVRVITESVKDCYAVLGLAHSHSTPIPGRFRDYIATPKPNMYRSLHTTVIHTSGLMVELQIRTREMHYIAEYGIAAHWHYKETGGRKASKSELDWLKSLLEWQGEVTNQREFLSHVQGDLFADEIFVLTPKGKVIALPRGSTPLDFAYHVHTDLGNHTTGARVNGHMMPLRTELANGDVVEILSSQSHNPSRDWLNIVHSNRARNKIRQFFKLQELEALVSVGREILRRLLHRRPGGLNRLLTSKEMAQYLTQRGISEKEFFYRVGNGTISARDVVEEVFPHPIIAPVKEETEGECLPLTEDTNSICNDIYVDGMANVELRLARCCHPRPGDSILALVTRGRGVSIHRMDCGNVQAEELQPRILPARFAGTTSGPVRVNITIQAGDRRGILVELLQIMNEQGGDVKSAKVDTNRRGGVLRFDVALPNAEMLPRLRSSLSMVESVHSVRMETIQS